MQWLFLIVGCSPFVLMAYLAYDDTRRNSNYFIPVSLACGMVTETVWAIAARYIGNNFDIYVFDLCWDTLLTLIFILVPIVCCNMRFNWIETAGIVMVGIGLLVLKFGSHL